MYNEGKAQQFHRNLLENLNAIKDVVKKMFNSTWQHLHLATDFHEHKFCLWLIDRHLHATLDTPPSIF
jgi:chromosome condensin MukBEF ATPase and DNA-binding subunit MukB